MRENQKPSKFVATMEIKIKIISTEIIKPSSPTPKSLQKHQLSFLDQIAPNLPAPFFYLYQSNPIFSNSQKSINLKKSLSQALSRFYPLAGRLVGNLYVDCNDGGVPFYEAEADCDLSQVISNPDLKHMRQFLHSKMSEESKDLCMAVQATYFRCGGLLVGHLISHKIADALSSVIFTNTWSAFARNGDVDGGVPLPKLDAAAYFPPTDASKFKDKAGVLVEEEPATRIFTFPASEIAHLQEQYSVQGRRRPSRVEALSAFIWTRFVSATGRAHKMSAAVHIFNLRSRVDPPLSEYHFGNIVGSAIVSPAAGDGGAEFVRKVREAMAAVNDGSYVARAKESEKQLELMKEREERMVQAKKGELLRFSFSSLCKFPMYEADFGWGKPVWAGPGGFPSKNVVLFKDSRSGGDIEALIHLSKQDMNKFQADLGLQMLKSNL